MPAGVPEPSLFPRRVLIELAVDSAADAARAFRAGADRIELASDLALQGLTASSELIAEARSAMPLPIAAMVRPRAGDFCSAPTEHDQALRETAAAVASGASAIVFGCLTSAGYVDRVQTREIIREASGLPTVFHRAFDFTPDWSESLEELIALGVSRVLTAGIGGWATGGSVEERAERVRALAEQAAGGIEVLPGGGIRPSNARVWLERTGLWQLHSACRSHAPIPCGLPASLDAELAADLRRVCDGFITAQSPHP